MTVTHTNLQHYCIYRGEAIIWWCPLVFAK